MASGRGGGRLGDVKGGDALSTLLKTLAKETPAKPPAAPASREDLAAAMTRRNRIAPPPSQQARKAAAKVKSKKEVIKIPRRLAEEAIRQADAATVRSAPSQPKPVLVNDFGAASYGRISRLRPALEQFVADARAPDAIDDPTRTSVARLVELGASAIHTVVDPAAEGYIGHDFGTSSTKAVVRWPYDRALGAYGVPVPSAWSSGGVPHLWPTIVHLHPVTGRFTLLPEPEAQALSGFKSALIEGRGHRHCAGSKATMASAATAFLTLHLAYVLGTVLERQSESKVSGLNIGVPVAALADKATQQAFAAVARAATLLIPNANNLTLNDVEEALATGDGGALPVELHTELSGAIAGYCAGPRPYLGPHMIIDCGSATLDIASFQLGNEPWPIAIHAAGVEPLGADACVTYQAAGATHDDCRGAARHHEHRIFAETLHVAQHDFGQDEQRRYQYQVIVIGGGMSGPIHGPLFDNMADAFQRPFHRPTLDPGLALEVGTQPGRLILADGLARAPVDLREVAMPRDRPRLVADDLPVFISKDQV